MEIVDSVEYNAAQAIRAAPSLLFPIGHPSGRTGGFPAVGRMMIAAYGTYVPLLEYVAASRVLVR